MMVRALRVASVVLIALAAPLASSASAHEFVASRTGKGKVRSTTAQVFKTAAITVECAKASGSFEVMSLKGESIMVHKLAYSECTGFGTTVDVSDGSYEFHAGGSMSVAKALTISPLESGCSITLGAGANEERMLYANNSGKLQLVQELTKLSYRGSGGVCGGEGEGKLDGTLELELEGGTIEWR